MSAAEEWNVRGLNHLPGLVGVEFLEVVHGRTRSRLVVRPAVMTPHGYLHAATVIALADTSCGYGAMISLPEGARSFTTIERKANFLGTVREGTTRGRTSRGGDSTGRAPDASATASTPRVRGRAPRAG